MSSGGRHLPSGNSERNFTVEGLSDDEVCIGDRYRIGEALFEVTQTRATCYRVGIRMHEPRMASFLASHERPGFYPRCTTTGLFSARLQLTTCRSASSRIHEARLSPAPDYVPPLPCRLSCRGLTPTALDIAILLAKHFRLRGEDDPTKALVCSFAAPSVR
jgi:hypothetical protein